MHFYSDVFHVVTVFLFCVLFFYVHFILPYSVRNDNKKMINSYDIMYWRVLFIATPSAENTRTCFQWELWDKLKKT